MHSANLAEMSYPNKQVSKEKRQAEVAGSAGCVSATGMVYVLCGVSCGYCRVQKRTFSSHMRLFA